jgi:nucleoside-diphosphate-sugar epimerase
MRILVTGATGFIGRRLMAQLLERFGASAITCVVHTPSTPKPGEAEAVENFKRAGVTLLPGDLTKTPITDAPPPTVDVVFHLAANIDTDTPEEEHRVNDRGTANLLAWLRPTLRGCRIVYTSSIAVLDRNGIADGPLKEDSPSTPRTAYGATKMRGEEILREAATRDGFSWTILRLPTVYGPGEKTGGLFDLLITGARTGGLISRVNWPGRSSVIYVDDAAAILIDLAWKPTAANQVYCISSGEDLTLLDIAREAGVLVSRPVKPIHVPMGVWRVVRSVAWNPLVRSLVPQRAHVTYWRLTLVVDDGFWFDAQKFLSQNTLPLVSIREGLRRTIEAGKSFRNLDPADSSPGTRG